MRALRREGGEASGAHLGTATCEGHRVNGALARLVTLGLVHRTGRKDGRSPIWAITTTEEG